jgi:hypothetical protein
MLWYYLAKVRPESQTQAELLVQIAKKAFLGIDFRKLYVLKSFGIKSYRKWIYN